MPPTPLRSHEAEVRPERRAAERLLQAGEFEEAQRRLQAWLEAEPDDAGAKGLLGLCCFRQGRLEEAAAIYTSLVERNPDDPTLRVNLGLVALKQGDAAEAARQFEVAVSLAPGHQKALNYLGLALAQRGSLELARDAFERAGASAMAERMAARIAERGGAEAQPPTSRQPAAQERPEEPQAAEVQVAAAPAADAPAADAPAVAPAVEPGQPIPAAGPSAAAPRLADLAAEASLRWPVGRPFAVGPDGAAVEFDTEIRTRLDGLVAAHGVAAWTPVQKRFRGEEIDRLFGGGPQQMWRATGGGRLLFRAADRTFTPLYLEGETYLVEERLFAFEESLRWENGRLPGQAADLHLVRFTRTGQVLLCTEGAIRTELLDGGCLSLPSAGLVGWSGNLAPRLVGAEEGPAVPWIELSGSGLVLLVG